MEDQTPQAAEAVAQGEPQPAVGSQQRRGFDNTGKLLIIVGVIVVAAMVYFSYVLSLDGGVAHQQTIAAKACPPYNLYEGSFLSDGFFGYSLNPGNWGNLSNKFDYMFQCYLTIRDAINATISAT